MKLLNCFKLTEGSQERKPDCAEPGVVVAALGFV